ncbi:MAG: hypothetical protein J6O56_04750 [Bacilli bacterium]|nr:hypothetical protein [Bacilli bacterium]
MKITIGYLYFDLLNLYGDSGNIKTLLYHLKEQGVKVDIKYISLGDKIDFDKIDLLYTGSGTNNNLLVALEDIKKYKKDIEKFIKDKKFILATGNSLELFGNYIVSSKKIKALGIFDYVSMYQKRIVKDVNVKSNIIEDQIIGFENHNGNILTFDEDIIKIDNFYGTYIIGPLLVRNPKFCSYFIKELITSKDKDFKFKEGNYKLDELAYENAK